jgi:hypothetical protein
VKRRIVQHPTSETYLLSSAGHGGPGPAGPSPKPGPRILKPGPSLQLPNPTQGITDALGSAFQSAAKQLIPPGQVLIGVVLVAVGLILATGQGGRVGKAGLFVATRGAIK